VKRNWLLTAGLITILLALTTHLRFAHLGNPLPQGCDEFGYLNMARALADGNLLDHHAPRPFFRELHSELKNTFPNADRYRWMVAPHAYHVVGDKLINQYPPGVAMMLAPFPLEHRRSLFPSLVTVLVCLVLIATARVEAWGDDLAPLHLIPLVMIPTFIIGPLSLELKRVNSVSPTYGLLIAAGWLLPRRPLLSLFALSATTVFRVPNAILALPFALAYLFLVRPVDTRIPKLIRKGLTSAGVFLLTGFGIYASYVWLLLGSPFRATYSTLDQDFAEPTTILNNIYYYLVDKNGWFIVHLAALAVLGAVCYYRRENRWFLFGVALTIYNYSFYFTHNVTTPYYPYASSLIVLGLALAVLRIGETPARVRRSLAVAAAATCILLPLITALAVGQREDTGPRFHREMARYQDTFSSFHVVWAEKHSGTVEYAADRAGFRYNWGVETRAFAMHWLRRHGYDQAIWADDENMPTLSELKNALQHNNVPYHLEESPLGKLLVIERE
jgi:hypothetical protein